MKRALGSFLVFILLLIGLALALPFLIDLNRYQDRYRPIVEEALNRTITLKDVRLTLLPRLGVRLAGLTVMDDPAFSSEPFASLSSLDIGIKLLPLFSRRVEVANLTLRDPVITVVTNRDGIMNVSTLGGGLEPTQPEPLPHSTQAESPMKLLALLAVEQLAMTGGRLTYRDQSAQTPSDYQVRDLDIRLSSLKLGGMPEVHLSATVLPFNLPVKLDATGGPLSESGLENFQGTIFVGSVTVNLAGRASNGAAHVTLTSPLLSTADFPGPMSQTKPVIIKDLLAEIDAAYPPDPTLPPMELAEIPLLRGTVLMGSSVISAKGTLKSGRLLLAVTAPAVHSSDIPTALPLKGSVVVNDLEALAELDGPELKLSKLAFQVFDGRVSGQAGMTLGEEAPPFSMKLSLKEVQLGPAFKVLGVDSLSVSGGASADLAFRGAGFGVPDLTRSLVGTGSLRILEGRIEGFNLKQELYRAFKVLGVPVDSVNATAFSVIEGDLTIGQGTLTVQRFLVDSHDFNGTVSGTIGFDQSFKLRSTLNLSEPLSMRIADSSAVAKLALSNGRLSVPLLVTGTAQAPSYQLDVGAVAGKLGERLKEVVQEKVGNLFKKPGDSEPLIEQGQETLKELFGR